MPLFRALAKNMAASYFGKNYLTQVRPLYGKVSVMTLTKYVLINKDC
jgi:hypothetical protein